MASRGADMKGLVQDIESLAVGNRDFRRVLYTAKHCQVVHATRTDAEADSEHFDGKTSD
jgi:hypothetical protein